MLETSRRYYSCHVARVSALLEYCTGRPVQTAPTTHGGEMIQEKPKVAAQDTSRKDFTTRLPQYNFQYHENKEEKKVKLPATGAIEMLFNCETGNSPPPCRLYSS